MLEITPEQVQELLPADPASLTIVDVREADELGRGVLPGAVHIAMSGLAQNLERFQPGHRYVIYCEHGVRSLHVAAWLIRQQIDAVSMSGGYAVWSGPTQAYEAEAQQ